MDSKSFKNVGPAGVLLLIAATCALYFEQNIHVYKAFVIVGLLVGFHNMWIARRHLFPAKELQACKEGWDLWMAKRRQEHDARQLELERIRRALDVLEKGGLPVSEVRVREIEARKPDRDEQPVATVPPSQTSEPKPAAPAGEDAPEKPKPSPAEGQPQTNAAKATPAKAAVKKAAKEPAATKQPEKGAETKAAEAKAPETVAGGTGEAVQLLCLLQQKGRLVDFLMDDISGANAEDLSAAARVVHQGCREVFKDYCAFAPVRTEKEDSLVRIAADADMNEYKLLGDADGKPPYQGKLRHAGWKLTKLSLPRIKARKNGEWPPIQPAEVDVQAK